jgi:two-component system sensor histidine kinase DesK
VASTLTERTDSVKKSLRGLNLTVLIPPMAAIGVFLVVVDAENWVEAVVLAAGAMAGLLVIERWTADDDARITVACLAVSAGVWVFGALASDSHSAFFGISIVGPVAVPRLTRRRLPAAFALVGFVSGVGAVRLLLPRAELPGDVIPYLVVPTIVLLMATGLMFANQLFYNLIGELEEAREREADVAVFRERVRFASDLHDIQGHTLHVVKLKTALAEKLVHTDAERARAELREIHELVTQTITQTKELAYAQRRLNLAAEVENAKNLFEAAGIAVRVERDDEVDVHTGEMLGQVLRETTTNILRHAQATRVRISLSGGGIAITNDGAAARPPELRGLATLKHRVAEDGGVLTVRQEDGHFTTAAEFPRSRDRKDGP